MKQSVLFFVKYYLFWIAFFLFFKIFFLLYNISIVSEFGNSNIIGIFARGFIMDISAAGYLSLLPGLLIAIGFVFFPKLSQSIIKYYTLFILIIVSIMGISDAGLFEDWGSRINAQIFLYLQNPKGMYSAMGLGKTILLFSLWTAISTTWFLVYKKTLKAPLKRSKWLSVPVLLFLTSSLIIPIRGGLNTSPLNHSNVYFSENTQVNQSTYNYFWNFFYSLSKAQFNENPVNYMSANDAREIVENYITHNETYPSYIKHNSKHPTNVVFILLESFSSKIIGPAGGLTDATPRLNEWCKRGVLFTNFYATGNRSDKGMCALVGGYPSVINATTVLAIPEKMHRLYYFPKQYKKHGYDLSFYYGGDINFYNTRAALIQSGFSSIISDSDFPSGIASLQKWGVPDHYLYERFMNDLLTKKQPFFSMVYNISSHEPFDIPNYHKIKNSKYLNSIAYSDSCLGVFLDKLEASPLWENTLVVITSDHTDLQPGPTSIQEPESYRIPLLWTGGAIDTSFVCEHISMHNDLGPTLIQQMGWKDKMPKFSKNIFSSQQYAFYFRNTGWGFVSPSLVMFQNINTKKSEIFLDEMTKKSDSLLIFAKSYVQYLHDDFLN